MYDESRRESTRVFSFIPGKGKSPDKYVFVSMLVIFDPRLGRSVAYLLCKVLYVLLAIVHLLPCGATRAARCLKHFGIATDRRFFNDSLVIRERPGVERS